jgi:peptidoglycan/LPS O-acetylase OafA/YrhL
MYLVHGIVYYSAMKLRGGIHAVSLQSYMLETAVCMTVILLLSTVIHLVLEQPTMKLSEQIARLPQTIVPEQSLVK